MRFQGANGKVSALCRAHRTLVILLTVFARKRGIEQVKRSYSDLLPVRYRAFYTCRSHTLSI